MPMTATPRAAACLFALSLGSGAAFAQDAEHLVEREQHLALDGAGHVRVEHLAGPVIVEAHDDASVTVRMVIHAAGDTQALARERAEAVDLEHGREGGALWIRARPPLDEHRTLFYAPPDAGAGYNRSARFAGERVTIRSLTRWGRHGVPVHVDLHVLVPRGTGLDLTQHAGPVTVRGLSGPVRLKLQGDPVRASAIEAPLEIDSGSGRVEVLGHRGPARVASGSADMHLKDLQDGPLELSSSSGQIRLIDASGVLSVKTGSGGLEASDIQAGDRLSVISGSGDVRLQGNLTPARELEVTSSGGDILLQPADAPNARIRINSARGGINVDLPGLSEVRAQRTRFTAVAGEGLGRWQLENRMGRVRIVSDPGLTGNDDLFGDG